MTPKSLKNFALSSDKYGPIKLTYHWTWPCTLSEGKFRVSAGFLEVRVDTDESVSIEKLAKFASWWGYAPYVDAGKGGMVINETELMSQTVADIRRLNPSMKDSDTCSGRIILSDSTPPFRAYDAVDVPYTGQDTVTCPCLHGETY